MMNIKEKVGEYEVIANGTVLIFETKSIELKILNSELKMEIEFIQDSSGIPEIKKEVKNKTFRLSFYNYIQADGTTFGLSNPMDVGHWENNVMYFNCCGTVIDKSKGIIVFNYSFWKHE